ncbi:MAG: hypothetical protein DCC58_19940 [Chloroflexi bacterium]|nr:MAG: hypothetical protein DCC58_19940 [Chloroflexota bacterium]
MLTRALGIRPSVPVDQHSVALAPGDIVLLCSDGLHRFLGEERIAAILGAPGSDDPAAALVAAVAEQHGRDDVTVVVVAVQPAERAQSPASDYLSLLLRVGPELARGLDVDRTQSTVLHRLLELTGGERAAILLTGAGPGGDEFVLRAGHDLATSEQHVGFSRAIARRSVAERAPVLLADALGAALSEPGAGDRSVVIQGIRAAVCVPLRSGDAVLGALYVDSLSQANRFDAATVDLLEAFAALAAPAIENARLHAELSGRTRELEAVRHTQDSLVRSLSSALVALDARDCITEWNPAAADLFQVSREAALGRSLGEVTPPGVANWLIGMQVQAEAGDRSLILGNTWDGAFGARARVVLAGRVARIHDGSFDGGHVFIINDRTDITLVEEARREQQAAQERQRALFSRYLAPAVVERALRSPDDVQLGGARQQVTILFADVRGFTGYSEAHSAEAVVDALNTYLALATNEIFAQFGTLDKFLGDGVMAIFGAPLPLEQHAAAAVRAALAIRERALALRRERGAPFAFGFGINTGDAVVGNIGAQQLMNYTAIGDTVNVASRLEEAARAGEVLITQATLDACAGAFAVEELGPLYVKGRAEPIATYKVIAAN